MFGRFYLTLLLHSHAFLSSLRFFLDVHAFPLAEFLSGISMSNSLSLQLFFSGFVADLLQIFWDSGSLIVWSKKQIVDDARQWQALTTMLWEQVVMAG